MIAHLRGSLLRTAPDQVVLDVGGVGYLVHVPLSTYYELQDAAAGDVLSLHVHTHVRDDALLLFGFWTERERHLFEKLIAVSGIGPKLAQTVLSGMSPDDLIASLASRDVRRLSGIPGIGKKTAERMILELRDKVQGLAVERPERPGAAHNDLVLALVNLGYRRPAAEKAVVRVAKELPDAAFADQLKASLKLLSRV